jgi:penicillin-binding protein 1C
MSVRIRRVLHAGLALALGAGACAAQALPRFAEVQAAYRSSDTRVLDRHGALLQRVRTDPTVRRLDWVALPEVSAAFRQALLLSEDKHFYEHSGVDWSAVGAAAWNDLWNTRTRGASTVTMQLAGLIDADLAAPKGGRTLAAKIGQVKVAWQLEHQWTKDQILEAYLNLVPLRGEVVGIGALSATLFQKAPSGLDADEAAIAAALVRAPNAKAADVAQRACGILKAEGRRPACEMLAATTRQLLTARHAEAFDDDDQLAPHLARHLLAERAAAAGQRPPALLRTTLDARLQRFARDSLREHLRVLRDRNVEDGAVIVLDNASGDVLAWVGSSGAALSQAAQVDGVTSLRQAGSTLKPFLYELAIERRWLTAASLLDDSPVGLATAAGLYVPQDYDHRFKGWVSVRSALGASLNVPAVRTAVMVTPARFAQRLQALGLPLAHDGDHYGYSIALGTPEITLASLANAYRALANGGIVSPLQATPDARPPARAARVALMDPAASFIVADILADREARTATFGLDNALSPRYWAAVKTGTSKDMRDNWCVGFSRRYTVGVWVGNASGEPMWDVSGVSGAAPVWRAVMDRLEDPAPAGLRTVVRSTPPSPPPGVVQARVTFEDGREPARPEWFLVGTEQARIALSRPSAAATTLIASPADHTILALDPDMPPQVQQLRLMPAPGIAASWRWRLDGKPLGRAVTRTWPLWPGQHLLELLDERGQVREASHFEVRGVSLKPHAPGAATTQRRAALGRCSRQNATSAFKGEPWTDRCATTSG